MTIGRYFYDGEGKRVKKETDTETTVFVYSAGKLIAEYSTQISQTPQTKYLTEDHLGTPRIITNELGAIVSRRDFMPFGEELYIGIGARSTNLQYGTSADDVKQKFTGYQKDNETGLDFAEARMYASELGRFTAVDPWLASGKSAIPQSFNRYVYVGNSPIRFSDPNGLDWWDVINNSTGRREIRWFDDDPDEDEFSVNQRWTEYVYRASDGRWYALDPNSANSSMFHDAHAAKLKYGIYTDFNGDFDGFLYDLFQVKDFAYFAAYLRTNDIDNTFGQFGKIAAINGVGAGIGRYLAPVDDLTVLGLNSSDDFLSRTASSALVPAATRTLGNWGEQRLAQVLGGAVEKNTKPIATTLGNRIPDFLVDGVAHEAKAGLNVGLSSTFRKQIVKDAELIETGRIKGAHWHFFQGAQQEVLDFLTQNGIKYTVH